MARTHDEVFQAWKATNPTERFRDHWQKRWEDQLRVYLSLGWQLIPVRHREKQPARGANWRTEDFSYEVLRWHVLQGGNIAVNAGDSGIVVLDYDSKEIARPLYEAMRVFPTVDTAKGYAFITKPPVDGDLFDELKKRFPDFDSPRGEGKYELMPFSETCAVAKHDTKEARCPPHDFRVREWYGEGLGRKIPFFLDFCAYVM